ncbi:RagB/SusD family nutrient uptake outer membrane protein [Lutibacter sp.]|uniref:RagB/SusD family nutrient uptake outer membrane protein n=1 Tax=Lutibacter sp. TaxID=1925666 RepID=UPI002733A536|nr:RagB/SusD family nutrient uptake outer membrane protein [Lutibacter sp.]MDP3314025.1 RagB/SusD family nutrient uptake outer membrane protein [Lutibacter sp.]
MKITKYIFTVCLSGILFTACTNLEEKVYDGVELESAASAYAVSSEDASTLLNSAYTAMRGAYQDQARLMALDEMAGDGMVGPTRGGDWDDAGAWRKIHTHTMDPNHGFNKDTYNDLYSLINAANLVIGSTTATAGQVAEAKFLRALHYYHVIDLYGSAAYREIGSDTNADALVYTRKDATDWVIAELESIIAALPSSINPTKANKNAAYWLLAKLYLNYGVFAGDAASPTFDAAKMDKVISNVNAITGKTLAANYWDNFIPKNSETSSELIFVSQNIGGSSSGNIRSRWFMGQHYNQTPSGWNGFTTLGEYYDKFNPNDVRIKTMVPSVTANSGYNVGFHIGQQYGPGGPGVGPALKDRLNQNLVFTKALTLITGGNTLETAGVRGVKYVPDYTGGDNADNDYVVARYADALLMKAEAMSRKGDNAGAQALVRTLPNESATVVASTADLNIVRARELWWEGWRRNDMIRFGTFLQVRALKPYVSDKKYLLNPIPLPGTTNPNMVQNPGY